MLEEDKKEFIDKIQKNIAKSCQSTCKSLKNQTCFQTCFQKYLKTIETVNQTIKQQAYKKHSIIGYKAYPEPQIQMQHHYNQDILMWLGSYSFAKKWDSSV